MALSGEFNFYNIIELKKAIRKITDGTYSSVVVNLADVSYMDSSGIGVLYTGFRQMKKVKGDFFLTNVNNDLKDIFTLVGITIPYIDLTE